MTLDESLNSAQESDWRINNQEEFLMNKTLIKGALHQGWSRTLRVLLAEIYERKRTSFLSRCGFRKRGLHNA